MDLRKIGKFIAKRRQEKGFTQESLAEELNISNRSISKWERGICLPNASIMHKLCDILKITINDLFSGEVVDMKDNEKRLEENLLEMAKLKEGKDKQLLRLEMVIGYTASITFLTLIFVASFVEMAAWLRILLIIIGSVIFAFGVGNTVKIEQIAGYYECSNCNHKYVPTYQSVFWARHMGRTRKMKCPKCSKRSWQKKVIWS